MVPFDTFWSRLQAQLSILPEKDGYHYGEVEKWSHDKEFFGERFAFLYKGGHVIYAQTASTDKIRSIASAEFEKVYKVWEEYRSGTIPRSHIVGELGVQNSSWIIPLLKKYEPLMRESKIRVSEVLEQLETCAKLPDAPSRKLAPIGVLTKALQPEGIIPIVYGGAAVEWYLSGSHEAGDMDILCTNPYLFKERLIEIGFTLDDFEHLSHPLVPLDIHLRLDEEAVIDETTTLNTIGGYPVHMITVFQAILDYLHKFIEGPSNLEPVFVGDLLEKYSSEIDLDALLDRAGNYGKEHFHSLRTIIAFSLHKIVPP